jgi:vacuolar-type H+-ATPase subunit I/STV1
MTPTLAARVAAIESQMQTLQELPNRVASLDSRVASLEVQILRLRGEMREEFYAVRQEIKAGDEETRRYMRVLHEEVISRIKLLGER